MSGFETPNNPTGAEQPSETGQNEQLTAFKSMDTGSATSPEGNMGDEGKTTSVVNRAASESHGTAADDEAEDRSTELDGGQDAANGAGSDTGRPPLPAPEAAREHPPPPAAPPTQGWPGLGRADGP